MAVPNDVSEADVHKALTEAVDSARWTDVVTLLRSASCSDDQRRWAIEETVQHAQTLTVDGLLAECADDQLDRVVPHLLTRRLWRCVGRVLQRSISATQRWQAVETALKQASDDDFLIYVLPRCSSEELEQGLARLVSRGLWWSVYKALERGLDTAQHRWAVIQASKKASGRDFVRYILPHCQAEELDQVVPHLVSRRLWQTVGKVLERGINPTQHKWVVSKGSRHANDSDFVRYILPHCDNEQLADIVVHLVVRGMAKSLGKVLGQGLSTEQHSWAVVEAAKYVSDAGFDHLILRHCSEDDIVTAFPALVANRKWRCVEHILLHLVRDTLHAWITSEHSEKASDGQFWKFLHSCHVEESLALEMIKAVSKEIPYMNSGRYIFVTGTLTMISSVHSISSNLANRVSWQRALCESLITSLLHTLCYVMCTDDREYTDSTEDIRQSVSDIYGHITACLKDNMDSIQADRLTTFRNKAKWISVFTELANIHKSDPLFLLHFLPGLHLHHVSRRGKDDDAMLLVMLAVLPLFPQLQSEALRMMAGEQRWDVISQACLTHLWEHDRRRLFKSAVEEKQWRIVLQWADHTVHDDQRDWAMKEALKEKQWEVYLLLADHGLTMQEHMHANYMVAKYGDWNTVLQMVERGGDITEVSNLLETWVTGNLRLKPQGDPTVYFERCKKLIRLRLRFARNSALSPMKALDRCMWGSVLFNILHKPTEEYFSQVLHKVIGEQEWHILMHLVRLGMNRAERHWLFPQMVRQQQWGVCRKLLEIGVDVQLCLEALPELMDRTQWTLVARVMELEVDDAMRRQVMQCAFQRRAGVLFWHCLSSMKDKAHLPKETQEKLFHQAISREVWQAVKPLVEQKDSAGIQRRDLAFLEAIEQHLWDVVDYCQLHGADINMEDEKGETPLHREARKEEWKAIEEIVFRDGKPNLLDKDGVSVLNRLIDDRQWDTVKFVIKYGGNIHLSANYVEFGMETRTPLQALIDKRQMDIIQFTLMWCPEQGKGVNERGETTFHAACDSRRWDVMDDLIMRRVDLLAVTKTGQSALVYAVLNARYPQRMVAECCRLGLTTHQPSLTGAQESLLDNIISTLVRTWKHYRPSVFLYCDHVRHSVFTSPLVLAMLRDLPVVVLMLYESGSCSYTELFTLYTHLPRLTDLNTPEGRKLQAEIHGQHEEHGELETRLSWMARRRQDREATERVVSFKRRQEGEVSLKRLLIADSLQHYTRLTHIIDKYTPVLRELATTPRSLLSSCRLLISHCLNVHDKKRHQHVGQLFVPTALKNYIEFSDLHDPDFGRGVV